MKISRGFVILAGVPAVAALMFAAPAANAAAGGQRPAQRVPLHYAAAAARLRPSIAPSALAGFLWSGSTGYYSYDSSGGAVTVTSNYPTAGSTQVSFAGLQGIGDTTGDVQVTPYGTSDTCVVAGWGPDGSDELIDVTCYTPGALATTPPEFDLAITKPTGKPSGVYDYAWISPDSKSASLKTGYGQYNSSHKGNSVVHLGTGRYEVVFPGPRSSGTHGTVEVTTYLRQSTTSANCVTQSWKGTRTGEDVYVDCYSASGARQNDEFDVVYASTNNVLGLNGAVDANTLFSNRTAAELPVTSYFSNRHAGAAEVQYEVGYDWVFMPGSGGAYAAFGGDVQTEAVSSQDVHCNVLDWDQSSAPSAGLECYNRAGHLVNTPFEMQWVVQ
jgi:hypothetical protein